MALHFPWMPRLFPDACRVWNLEMLSEEEAKTGKEVGRRTWPGRETPKGPHLSRTARFQRSRRVPGQIKLLSESLKLRARRIPWLMLTHTPAGCFPPHCQGYPVISYFLNPCVSSSLSLLVSTFRCLFQKHTLPPLYLLVRSYIYSTIYCLSIHTSCFAFDLRLVRLCCYP